MISGFTFRLAHLRETDLVVGDTVTRDDLIGVMGDTGQSTGPHGHIDIVRGKCPWIYRMAEIYAAKPAPDFLELHYSIDGDLCGGKPYRITTYPYDPRYVIDGKWKPHPGVDIVIDDPIPEFYWNRSFDGEVIGTGFDATGYGHYVQIYYEK